MKNGLSWIKRAWSKEMDILIIITSVRDLYHGKSAAFEVALIRNKKQ